MQLVQIRKDGTTHSHSLPARGLLTIGRDPGCDIHLDDPSVSRLHGRLYLGTPPSFEDTDSANGSQICSEAPLPDGTRTPRAETAETPARRLSPWKLTPIQPGDVLLLGTAALFVQQGDTAQASARLRGLVGDGRPALVVEDEAMRRLYRMAHRVAESTVPVLILGETGVGKEVLASAIHRASPRASQPFVRLNCAAFPEPLLESELFGHEKGAFTGATQSKRGLLETAHGGTVLLDELGEMPAVTQVKLLRVIEERQVMPVGALKPRPIDVRFLAATNRDLEAEVARGNFREDLFYRLNTVVLTIPPLRERRAEILPLAQAMASEICKRARRWIPAFDPDAQQMMMDYHWPGNIRELRNVVERAIILSSGVAITPVHLPADKMRRSVPSDPPPPSLPPEATLPPPPAPGTEATEALSFSQDALRERLDQLERHRVVAALEQCGGNQTQAAKQLGISRRTLIARLEEYNLPRPRKPRS